MSNNLIQQAFPYYDSDGSMSGIGLTKREYFAGLAMQGLIASGFNSGSDTKIIAEKSTTIADALLAELKNKQ